jgi:hypothetical protein
MIGDNAWDNGSWVRTPSDVSFGWDDAQDLDYCRANIVVKQHGVNGQVIEWHPRDNDEARREYREKVRLETEERNRRIEELRAAWRVRVLAGPGRALKQYRNAIRKVGLMAVSEALGLG